MRQDEKAVMKNVQCDKAQDGKTHRLFPSTRLLVIGTVFLGNTFGNISFSLLNFTMVCMVNSTTVHDCNSEFIQEGDKQMCLLNGSSSGHHQSESEYFGDINWTRQQQGNILAAYSWGILFLAVPGGILMDRFGVKLSYLVANVVSIASFLLTPAAAYMGEWWLFAIRFIVGLTGGLFWPTVMASCARWAPKHEAGFLVALCSSGFSLGAFISNMISGSFCAIGPGGWAYAYYLWGSLNVVYTVGFYFVYSDNPRKNRFISDVELEFLLNSRAMSPQSKQTKNSEKVPWLKLATSMPVIVMMLSNFTSNYAYYLVTMFQPTYIKEVLLVDPRNNGVFSALPPMVLFIGRLAFGRLSDQMKFCSQTVSVRVFEFISTSVMCLCFVLLTFLDSTTSEYAIACFIVGLFFYSLNCGGFIKSMAVIAPSYVGIISGFAETLSGASSLVVPYVVGLITVNRTREEWVTVFYVAAAITMFGGIVFASFASGEELTWTKRSHVTPVNQAVTSAYNIDTMFEKGHIERKDSNTCLTEGGKMRNQNGNENVWM